jgi:tyrosine-protein kinase Etk/Wzc
MNAMPARDDVSADAEEITIFTYARMLWRRKWLVAVPCLLGILVAVGFNVWSPKVYEATATLVSPKEGGTSLLGGLAGGLIQQAASVAMPSLTPNRDLMVSVLKSKRVAHTVVKNFGLQERYGVRFPEDAVRELKERTSVVASAREPTISVSVEDTDPALAARMANYFIEQTDRLLSEFDTGGAGRERAYLTEQLARSQADLARAEAAVRRFQEQNRTVVLEEQAKGAIASAARLKGEVVAAEVQLQVMRSFATDANPDVLALRRRIQEMNKQLAEIEYGDGTTRRAADGSTRREFTLPLSQVPEVGLELARLTREVMIQSTLAGLLTQQVERTKLAEARDVPVVVVLDAAAPPRRPAKPRVYLNLGLGLGTGFIVGTAIAFFLQYLRPPPRPRAA